MARPKTAEAAQVAESIAESIKEWHELTARLSRAGTLANQAAAEARAELNAKHGPQGLLCPPPPPWPVKSAQDHLITRRKVQALQRHRAVWTKTEPFAWLSARPGFSEALKQLLQPVKKATEVTAESLLLEARVVRLIVGEVTIWALMRTGREAHDLQLHLTRSQMRKAAALATKLGAVLGLAYHSGSEVSREIYSTYDPNVPEQSLRGLLKQLATDLQAKAAEPSKPPRNNPTVVDRYLIATLANGFHTFHEELGRKPGDEQRPAIHAVAKALGITLEWENIDLAIDKAPRLFG